MVCLGYLLVQKVIASRREARWPLSSVNPRARDGKGRVFNQPPEVLHKVFDERIPEENPILRLWAVSKPRKKKHGIRVPILTNISEQSYPLSLVPLLYLPLTELFECLHLNFPVILQVYTTRLQVFEPISGHPLRMLTLYPLDFAKRNAAATGLQDHPEKGRDLGLRRPPGDVFRITNGSQVSNEIMIERPSYFVLCPTYLVLCPAVPGQIIMSGDSPDRRKKTPYRYLARGLPSYGCGKQVAC
ncbi:hypothetical protein B0H65DRAFT_437736 [Neurospora tetraspora]|uniref:Uncharacterized protein n=1 Tax=Neurospora tetraspora TaxID=94610 RepID=A0AAE0JMK6_9PEZI|nr:hypothetical protein B0H65DRAFT_437736 [Neurospora tetraspora]